MNPHPKRFQSFAKDNENYFGVSTLRKMYKKYSIVEPETDDHTTAVFGGRTCFTCGNPELHIRDYCEECCKFFNIKE